MGGFRDCKDHLSEREDRVKDSDHGRRHQDTNNKMSKAKPSVSSDLLDQLQHCRVLSSPGSHAHIARNESADCFSGLLRHIYIHICALLELLPNLTLW